MYTIVTGKVELTDHQNQEKYYDCFDKALLNNFFLMTVELSEEGTTYVTNHFLVSIHSMGTMN